MPLNVGIVGLGKMGVLHSGIVNSLPGAKVIAICERETLLARLAESVVQGKIALYKDHREMVRKERLDAVFVTTPIDTHTQLVNDIIQTRGDVNLFVEKPLGTTLQQAQAACNAVKDKKVVHMVGFQKRFSPIFQKGKDFIDSQLLGELFFFRATSFSSDVLRGGRSWRFRKEAGGVLLDLAAHLLDLLLWYFGEPDDVTAVKRHLYSKDVEDYVHAVLSYQSGLTGHIDTSWSVQEVRLPEISLECHGRNGTLTVTDDFLKLRLVEAERNVPRSQVFYKQSFNTSVPFLLADPEFTLEDQAFLSSVRNGTIPTSNFFEASKVNAVIDRISAAAR